MDDLDLTSLLSSPMLLGVPADSVTIIREWYEFVYIARIKSTEDVYKIGKTNNLRRRESELSSQVSVEEPSEIIYAWNIPRPLAVETLVKNMLRTNLWKDIEPGAKGASEMFKIPLYVMILIVRLSVLCVFVEKSYIDDDSRLRRRLQPYISGLRFNQIRWNKKLYPDVVAEVSVPYAPGTFVVVYYPEDAFKEGTDGEKYNGKTFYGVVVNYVDATRRLEAYYMINWEPSEDEFFINNSKAPAKWTRALSSGNRILDIEAVCNKFGIQNVSTTSELIEGIENLSLKF